MQFPCFQKSIEANKLKIMLANRQTLLQSFFTKRKNNSKVKKINGIRHGFFFTLILNKPDLQCDSVHMTQWDKLQSLEIRSVDYEHPYPNLN